MHLRLHPELHLMEGQDLEYVPSLHDKALAAALEAVINSSQKQKKTQLEIPSINIESGEGTQPGADVWCESVGMIVGESKKRCAFASDIEMGKGAGRLDS
ncbi:hypothetical protein Tco_1339799 [Tanacetum coccineum]